MFPRLFFPALFFPALYFPAVGAVAGAEVRGSGERVVYEQTTNEVITTGHRSVDEWTRGEVKTTGVRALDEYLRGEVRATGLRIIYEYIIADFTDLKVTKTVNDTTPLVGGSVVWTILVENISAGDAHDVVLSDLLPPGVAYVSHVASVGTYVSGTGIWTIGTLLAGQSATLNITSTVLVAGITTNTATASSTEPDSNPTDNVDTETINASSPDCPDMPLPLSFPEMDADLELKDDTCQDEV